MTSKSKLIAQLVGPEYCDNQRQRSGAGSQRAIVTGHYTAAENARIQMIEFNANTLSDLSAATSREWLETNGLGGFSSSTIIGLNTRRYHGLLTAATKPPVGRIVTLSKLEDVLVIDGIRYELS